MKIQIRKGVFETNSSSTHSLTIGSIKEPFDVKSVTGDAVLVGKTSTDKLDEIVYGNSDFTINGKPEDSVDWQKRLDLLYRYCICDLDKQYGDSIIGFLNFRNLITNTFAEYGVEAVFVDDEEWLSQYLNFYFEDNPFEDILYCTDKKEQKEMLIGYLFGDVLYYSFCDECCSDRRYNEFMHKVNETEERFDGNKTWRRKERY